jgi:ABC-type cobalamin transport system ATPase subunit
MSNEAIQRVEGNFALNLIEKIRLAAFLRYLAKGKNHGSDMQDWHYAEAFSKTEYLNDRIEELCRAYSFGDGQTC